jgi:hypothetical protein
VSKKKKFYMIAAERNDIMAAQKPRMREQKETAKTSLTKNSRKK